MIKRLARSGLALIIVWLLSVTAVSAMEIFPLDQVEPGMRGKGKTVIQGTKIEDFNVEVISVIPQTPPTPPLVMIQVSGDVIDRSGGIAAGMSGSPIYIEDKLLGAIGYGYSYTDHRVGLVTPAEPMLELIQQPQDGEEAWDLPEGITPLRSPLLVSGFGGRALELLTNSLDRFNLEVIPGASGVSNQDFGELEPGSAFGVQLLRGDFQAASFGTVTYVDDDRFVGFGHPFTHQGEVNYFVTPATVHHTMANLEFPFKVASAGPTVGTLDQDRAAGVAGRLDGGPEYLPVTLRVIDKDRKKEREFYVESVLDDSLVMQLVTSSVYQGIDATLDRIGQGTAYVRIEYNADNLPNRIIRENMYFSESDIAVWTLYDLIEGLELLIHNRFQAVELSNVEVDVEVERKRNTATIEKAVPVQSQVRPGETVEVEVSIRPYRGKVEQRVLRVPIPEDTLPGLTTISVRSGGSGYYSTKPTVHTGLQPQEDNEEKRRDLTGGESLEKLIEQYMDRERNNEIVAEFYPFIDRFAATEPAIPVDEEGEPAPDTLPEAIPDNVEPPTPDYQWNDDSNEPVRVRLATHYVIEGMATFDLEIAEHEEETE